jgi:hypothetical protein
VEAVLVACLVVGLLCTLGLAGVVVLRYSDPDEVGGSLRSKSAP